MAQFGRPDGDITVTSFTGTPVNSAGNRYQNVDESTASDTDFNYGTNNTAATYECSLSNVTDPVSSSGHTFRYKIAKTNAGTPDGGGNAVTVTASLYQGTTLIGADAAQTATGTWTQYSYTLTAGEADAITDYSDLRLRFNTSASGGSPANRRGGAVSWGELEVPDAPTVSEITGTTSLTFSPTGGLQGDGQLIATTTLTAAVSGSLTGEGALIGSSTVVFSLSATIQGQIEAVGAAAVVFSPTAILQGLSEGVGSSTLTFTATGTLSAYADAVGAVTLTFSPTAGLTGMGELVATTAVVFTPSAMLGGVGEAAGSVNLAFLTTGDLLGVVFAVGTSQLTFSGIGDLTGVGNLAGAAPVVFAPTGTLIGEGTLVGNTTVVFTGSGDLTGVGQVEITGTTTFTFIPTGILVDGAILNQIAGVAQLVFVLQGGLRGLGFPQSTITSRWSSQSTVSPATGGSQTQTDFNADSEIQDLSGLSEI